MAVFLAFSRAPLTGPNWFRQSDGGGPGVHRLSIPTELLDQRFRKPNPLRRGNVASSEIGIVRKPTRCRRESDLEDGSR